MPKNKSEGVALINETDQRLEPEKESQSALESAMAVHIKSRNKCIE